MTVAKTVELGVKTRKPKAPNFLNIAYWLGGCAPCLMLFVWLCQTYRLIIILLIIWMCLSQLNQHLLILPVYLKNVLWSHSVSLDWTKHAFGWTLHSQLQVGSHSVVTVVLRGDACWFSLAEPPHIWPAWPAGLLTDGSSPSAQYLPFWTEQGPLLKHSVAAAVAAAAPLVTFGGGDGCDSSAVMVMAGATSAAC